ncbi:hypothetical protein OGAPHI_003409 [Ogataea philodendri]|uniref:SAP domain-containing protein n=1 Tax=Ogataea philodendri TaxID=1378263 RepID=A0A9P8P953_9ASCO|nr:uncharacterized protein OGAPHI_003409 [Ogataea philodendri]KAH3666959.1 hypothetical protein OGAPHI_003409 [Ogataea philodendri]
MAGYSSQTVPQLKEVLKQRGLSTNGVKADLIARLEESDKIEAQLDAEDGGEQKKVEPEPVQEPASTAEVTNEEKSAVAEKPVPVVETESKNESVEKEAETAPKEEKKPISPEELKQAAVELLTKKIARAKKFGNEDEVPQLEASLRRIDKFGLSLDSALARDLGFKPAKPHGNHNHKNGKHKWRK